MAKPTEHEPQPVPGHPGWVWWPAVNGWPEAKRPNGTGEPVKVRARNFTELLAKIRKREGSGMDQQIAELEHLFPGAGWVFGTVWQTANSGPDRKNLTARRGTVLLAAPDVPSLAEKIRHEEAR